MTLDELDEKLDAKTPEAARLWAMFARGAQIYSTPLFSLKKTDEGHELNLTGSGTFVRQGDRYFILTAGHVWHEMLKKADFVGVTLREVHDHTCFIETKAIVPSGPDRPASWNEWGPDIIFLEIPAAGVGEIKAFKGFYEMDARMKAMIKADRNETYLLVGTPKVLGSYTQTYASVQLLGMWREIQRISQRTTGITSMPRQHFILQRLPNPLEVSVAEDCGEYRFTSTLKPARLNRRRLWRASLSMNWERPRVKE